MPQKYLRNHIQYNIRSNLSYTFKKKIKIIFDHIMLSKTYT